MYSTEQIATGIRNPDIALRELNRLYFRRLYTREFNENGTDIFAEDWDNLIILDACTHDLFEAEHTLPGRLERRQSRGSSTVEFLRGNFDDRKLHDVVYLTANPQLYRHDSISPSLHATVNIWQENGWNEEYRTVLPETVTTYAKDVAEEYPNKRLVVHYIQPHYPFIGPTGREHFDLDSLAVWDQIQVGELGVSSDVLRQAYRENFELVLPHVEDLLASLTGKSVVTSDHGQAFGERGGLLPLEYYGHPPSVYIDSLVEVPWLVYETGERKEVVAERPLERNSVDSEVVSDRLEQLGYVN